MRLGFNYHSNYKKNGSQIIVPGYIGVFIDSIARQVDTLYLFLEEQTDSSSTEEDYTLQQSNIILVSLGNKSTFYNRLLNPYTRIAIIKSYAAKMDAMLLRAPSPLAPHIFKALYKTTPVYPLIVGNYVKGLKDLQQPFVRKAGIILFTLYYQLLHNAMISKSKIFVNSGELLKENENRAKAINLIKTTTLSNDSFFQRDDTCLNQEINVLFTGRINFQKGLRELVAAVASLKDRFNITIHIVGWEEKGAFSYEEALKDLAAQSGIGDRIIFHGKKKVGEELNAYYRKADIYVIPSYHEGFPRTIWEAMAASLPVIATKVGSIPYYLENNKHALLIAPQSTEELADAITTIINNPPVRQHIISNAYTMAQDITLDKQAELLINQIKEYSTNE